MSSQTPREQDVRSLNDIETVVDADFHLTESQSDFISYIDSPFDKMLLSDDGDGELDILGGDIYPSAGVLTPAHTGKAEFSNVSTKDEVLSGMEMLDLDEVIVTPTRNLYLSCVQHDDLAAALGKAYTEWVIDKIADVSNGIHTPAVIAPQKPNKAAEYIDDIADEKSVCSVYIPPSGAHPPLGHEVYDPIYDAAESADLPVVFHNTSGGAQLFSFPMQFVGHNRYISNHVNIHAFMHMTHMLDIITRGVPVKHPDLKFVFQEAGLGYVPYFMKRFDNEYSEKREDVPMLEKRPSEYVRDHFYFTSQPVEGLDDRDYVNSMIKFMGGEHNLMFSSDYPHLDFDHSDELLHVMRPEFDDDTLRKVYGGTAVDVFDL